MNKTVEKAYEVMKNEDYDIYKTNLPDLEVGDVCTFNDVWDGAQYIEPEEGSYSYPIADNQWINYIWEILEKKEDEDEVLDTIIKITDIELL